HAQLQLLDQDVLHAVGAGGGHLGAAALGADSQLGGVDVGEDRQVADQQLGRVLDGVLGRHRAVGGDLELELVEVGALPDTGGVDVVADAAYGREDRVDRDHADRRLGPLVALGGDIAAAAGDGQRHLEPGTLAQ